MRIVRLALVLGAALAAAPVAHAQRTQAQATAPIALYLGGHTTTLQLQNPQLGPVQMTLALLPDGTGWLYSEAGPGGRLTPRLRYIYRWWVAQDGRFCYLYSPSPDRLRERSLWTCWRTGQAPDGSPALIDGAGNPLPVLSRARGNGLEARSRFFLESAARYYGSALPSPQDPATPPPP
jgi:hypothetical protein